MAREKVVAEIVFTLNYEKGQRREAVRLLREFLAGRHLGIYAGDVWAESLRSAWIKVRRLAS